MCNHHVDVPAQRKTLINPTFGKVNHDGTFVYGPFSGRWYENAGMFIMLFDGFNTVYTANIVSNSMTGIRAIIPRRYLRPGCRGDA